MAELGIAELGMAESQLIDVIFFLKKSVHWIKFFLLSYGL